MITKTKAGLLPPALWSRGMQRGRSRHSWHCKVDKLAFSTPVKAANKLSASRLSSSSSASTSVSPVAPSGAVLEPLGEWSILLWSGRT